MLATSESAIATPASSAVSVSRLMKNEASRLAAPKRGPRRSRTRSNTGRWQTAATRPLISAYTTMPITPTTTTHARLMPEAGAGLGVGDEVAHVDEPADGGEDAEEHAEDALHECSSMNASSAAATSSSGGSGVGQAGGVPAAQLDADVADAVERVVEDRHELVAHFDRAVVGRLDRRERAAHPPEGVLLLGHRHRVVAGEPAALVADRGEQPNGLDRRPRRLRRRDRLALEVVERAGRPDRDG